MRKFQTILVAVFLFVGMSSFTSMGAIINSVCSCGSPAGGSQTFYETTGETCCGSNPASSEGAREIFYKPGETKGTFSVIAVVEISNAEGQKQCCPVDA
jgi:hypothetical protein